uniref:Integrase catalytic domain-containing protein n=2 Tax=Lutzomyia longipalpis TaxID=7200 RepID=A0A1B0GIT4_LUTLO
MALRRFISKRGPPTRIFSDNGTNLKGAEKVLKIELENFDQERVNSYLANQGITWTFIPPGAPHMGGAWERLIRSVKQAVRATLKSIEPTDEVLLTVMAEAEYTVNSRPLAVLSESGESLTPNHFLIHRSTLNPPPGEFDADDLILKKMWKRSQHLANVFWSQWVHYYLPTLTRRPKWWAKGRNVAIGDDVIIVDRALDRNHWPRGLVVDVKAGKDGVVRSAVVRTEKGTYVRPTTKLCVLEKEPTEEEVGEKE